MAALRRVRTLHLRSINQSLVRRGVILIEDALRTASLPGVDGARLILVRRLSLGNIGSSWPSGAVAILIEERFRQLAASAVHAEEPGAETAPAVYFHDEVAPYLALAVRIALGKDTSAWFWPKAVNGWNPGLSRGDALRALLFSALTTSPGCFSGLRLLRALIQVQALSALLSALNDQDGPQLLRAFGWSRPDLSEDALQTDLSEILPNRFPWQHILADACSEWGGTGLRSFWLASALLSIAKPALQQSPALSRYASSFVHLVQRADITPRCHEDIEINQSSLGRKSAPRDKRSGHTQNVSSTFPHQLERQDLGEAAALNASRAQHSGEDTVEAPLASESLGQREVYDSDLSQASTTEFTPRRASPEDPDSPSKRLGDVTHRAGLFFLLPVLERTGLPQWHENHAEEAGPDFPKQVLRAIAHRLKTPSEDPIWSAVEETDEPCSEDLVQFWICRVRAYCRRVARIGLYSLICSSGRVSATPTHIDIFLRASDADIRVRRAGLDFDLGWVPWFKRVIHFHYLSQGDFNV